jgi:hypothetical protein
MKSLVGFLDLKNPVEKAIAHFSLRVGVARKISMWIALVEVIYMYQLYVYPFSVVFNLAL